MRVPREIRVRTSLINLTLVSHRPNTTSLRNSSLISFLQILRPVSDTSSTVRFIVCLVLPVSLLASTEVGPSPASRSTHVAKISRLKDRRMGGIKRNCLLRFSPPFSTLHSFCSTTHSSLFRHTLQLFCHTSQLFRHVSVYLRHFSIY
jgi:hypothetical protein